MARQKGDGKGNQGGGRRKGTPNRVTQERRELISEFLDENWDNFKTLYKDADPATKLKIYMATVEYENKGPAKTYKDELDELSGEKTRK